MKKSYTNCISNQAFAQFSKRFIPTVENVITEQSIVMVDLVVLNVNIAHHKHTKGGQIVFFVDK